MTQIVLITGAGTGIGRAIALTLAEQGFSLILCGRNLENLEKTRSRPVVITNGVKNMKANKN